MDKARINYSISVDLSAVPEWVWLLLIAVPLRFFNLAQESLWYDETFTSWIANLPWDRFFTAIRGDVHPPLWYIVEKIVVSLFGDSEIALRFPAAILSTAAVLLVWRIALDLKFDRGTAFVTGLLAAVLPSLLYYSQDARMYSLLTCCVLLMVWAAINDRWALFAIGGIGAVYTQNLAVFYVLGIGLSVLALRLFQYFNTLLDAPFKFWDWNRLIKPILALSAIVLAWLPWAVWGLAHQAANISQGFWMAPLTPGAAMFALPQMTMSIRITDALQINVYGVAIGLSLIALIVCRSWFKTPQGLIILTACFGVPVLLALVSVVWRAVYLPRALLPSGVLLMLLWAYTLTHLSQQNRRVALALVIPMLAIGVVAHFFPAEARVDIRQWAQPILQNWRSDDVLYHLSIDSDITLSHYVRYPAYLLPESNDLSQSLTDETKQAMGMQQVPFDGLRALGYKRAWLLYSNNPMSSLPEIQAFKDIQAHYPLKLIDRKSVV